MFSALLSWRSWLIYMAKGAAPYWLSENRAMDPHVWAKSANHAWSTSARGCHPCCS